MYIEDDELRDIYKTATTERLHKLEAGLMHLEKQPSDRAKLEEFLREAHTLKGDSRMLGVQDVETLTHQLEDCLAAVKRGESFLTRELCDRLYHGLDAIRQLVHEAVTGEAAGVNVFHVLAQLMGADSIPALEETPPANAIAEATELFNDDFLFPDIAFSGQQLAFSGQQLAFSEPQLASSQPLTADRPSLNTDTIDTIRVEAEKLDTLMRQAGELTVTKLRIARRMGDIEEILRLWEESSRDAFVNRAVLDKIEQGLHNGNFKQVQNFQHRAEQRLEQLGMLVNRLKNAAYEDTASLDIVSNELESGIKTLRLLPLSNIFNLFPRMVRDLAKQQAKEVNLEIEGEDTRVDRRILEEMKDPLMHILRNAIDHGIETPQERENIGKSRTATIRLRGYQTSSSIGIEVVDDGRGLNVENIKRTAVRRGICSEEVLASMTTAQIQSLIFAPGFSTRTEVTEISGRGIGLDVVRANVERLKGSLQVDSTPGMGCEFHLRLSTSIATTQVLIVEVNRTPYAMPLEFVEKMLLVSRQEIFAIEGSQTISFEGQPVSVSWLADLLELAVSVPSSPKALDAAAKTIPCILLQVGTERLGLLVDALLDRQDVVLKPQSKLIKRVRNISGATILGDGEVCMVLNPQDLLKSVQKGSGAIISNRIAESATQQKILLVEDSIIIRTQMKRLLEGAGYDVTIAVDGLEGFNKLRTGNFDAVVSDVEMPNMNGFALTTRIRQHREYSELPIVLVTTLTSDEDKRRGAEAGANAYLTKGDFDQKILIETLRRLI
jgi:two-component system chemotaxis sensor kinase CheA